MHIPPAHPRPSRLDLAPILSSPLPVGYEASHLAGLHRGLLLILTLVIVLVPLVGWSVSAERPGPARALRMTTVRVVDEGVLSPLTETARAWLEPTAWQPLTLQR